VRPIDVAFRLGMLLNNDHARHFSSRCKSPGAAVESLELGKRDFDVYRTFLLHPDWDLQKVAQDLGMQQNELRATLDRLTELSLMHSRSGIDSFLPANPEIGIQPLLQRAEAEIDERRAKLSRDWAALSALTSDYKALRSQQGGDGVERLTGVDTVRIRLQELSWQATSEVRAFMPGGALSPAALEASRPLDEQNLRRGVQMQTAYLDSVRNDSATVEYATWLASLGGETRTAPALPMRLILCDRSVAVIPLNVHASKQGAFLIHIESVVTALHELFDLVWEQALPLGETSTATDDAPNTRDLAMLKMLEEGMTDEGIGRKLGVSIRTVRRITAELMKRLNAHSRFQAGAEAVRRGWL